MEINDFKMEGNEANFLSFYLSLILYPSVLKLSSADGYLTIGAKSTSAPSSKSPSSGIVILWVRGLSIVRRIASLVL